MNEMETSLIGIWSNEEIKYVFNEENDLIIYWKKNNSSSNGKYYINSNQITFYYGKDTTVKWTGEIILLNKEEIRIKDTCKLFGEYGKIDILKKIDAKIHKNFLSTSVDAFKDLFEKILSKSNSDSKYSYLFGSFMFLSLTAVKPCINLIFGIDNKNSGFYDENTDSYFLYVDSLRFGAVIFIISLIYFLIQEYKNANKEDE